MQLWQNLYYYTVNCLISHHPWRTTKWSLVRIGAMKELTVAAPFINSRLKSRMQLNYKTISSGFLYM